MEEGDGSCPWKTSHITGFLPLTVREAVEVWLPTVKVTVPESALVTPLSVRLCNRPSHLITFISLSCRGTSWSFHWAKGASSRDTRHSKRTSSPSYTTQLSKNFRMLTSISVWQTDFSKVVTLRSDECEKREGLNQEKPWLRCYGAKKWTRTL